MDNPSKKSKKKEVLSIEVLEESGIELAGGQQLNEQIVRLLADRFDAMPGREGKSSVAENPRALRRLAKEAEGIKEILSANRDMGVKVPELLDYQDLKTKITRQEFEDKMEPVLSRIGQALDQILATESMQEVTDIEFLGGAMRVPKVKKFIEDKISAVSDAKSGVHMN